MEEIKLNLVLIGKTGNGKSATGNTLLDRPGIFKASTSGLTVTQEVTSSFRMFERYMLQIVDMPGLQNTDMDEVGDTVAAIKHTETALAMCYGGVDAFLYFIRYGQRFTHDERSALETCKTIFGDDFLKHVVLVMTFGDTFNFDMEDQPITFHEWCNMQKCNLKKLYEDCEKRAVLINNREKDNVTQQGKIQEIIEHVHSIKETTGRYTSRHFQLTEQAREKMIHELKAYHLRIAIQEKVILIDADLEQYSKNPSKGKEEDIRGRIKELKDGIKIHDKGYGDLKEMEELVNIVEEDFNNRIQKKNLSEKQENDRNTDNGCSMM